MKKFYVLIVVIICSAAQGFSQTWIGGSTGNWNTAANWSPATVPNSNTADVVFNTNVTVNLDVTVNIKSLTVSGSNHIVKIEGFNNINIASGNATAPGVTVDATSTLRLYQVIVDLADNIVGTINGTLILEGIDETDYAILDFPNMSSLPAAFTVNGRFIDEYGTGIVAPIDGYLRFSAGAKLELTGVAPLIPKANYNPSSEIIISGVTINPISFRENGLGASIGTLTYNCPAQSDEISLNIPTELVIAGSLNINGTNGNTLVLTSNDQTKFPTQSTYEFTVNGNLNITNNSIVALSNADDANSYLATVNGDFVLNGSSSSFSIQNSNIAGLLPTTLYVKGNINHTAGVITAISTRTATTSSLFNIELNNSVAQTITSTPQSFNNTGNQVVLRISNPTGVTLLSPLNVGMLGFSSNGKLNTNGTNFVTVMNPSAASYIVSGAGFVNGPVRRATNSVAEYIFPTGSSTTARYVSVFPTSTDLTTFEGSFSSSAPTNTTVTSPLTSIVGYYWEVDRISTGTNARVEITLPDNAPGGTNSNALIVAKSSGGADWVSTYGAAGSTFLPGDAAAGLKIRSEIQTSFSSFTIGILPMSAALPINLLSFTGNKSGSKANLNWRITDNSTPKSFDIMKSSDGVNFNKIGSVSGLQAKLSYDFTDNNLLSGNNFYRLKMFDIDGTISYSNIIVVMNGTSGTLISSMIPTMVVDRARLNISSTAKGNMQLVITDINGRIIQTQNESINAGNQEIWINATRLSSGYFQITGYINGEKTATIRFFKR